MTTLWAKHQYAKCFGHWVVSDPECCRCAVSDACEKRTKNRFENDKKVPEGEGEGDASGEMDSELSPLEYLLQSLDGKFIRTTEVKNNNVKVHSMRKENEEKPTVLVAVSETNRIMIAANGKKKIVEKLESIEAVETLLQEMLA